MSKYLLTGKNIIFDFSLIDSKAFPCSNIKRKMLHLNFFSIYLQVNQLEKHDYTHLLLRDLDIGRKLMMRKRCVFFESYEKRSKFNS